MKKEKQESLNKTLDRLRKEYGEGAIMRLGEKALVKIEAFSSGIVSLDHALGIGGYPRGRIIEIFGNEASGKTTIALHAAAEVQKLGGTCAFIDAEHALDVNYAAKIGLDVNNLYLSQPNDGEQALEIADELINSNAIDLIIIDSVAALVPRAEIQGQMGDAQMALQARLMSQALRKITGSSSKSKTAIIFINQIRMKIGQLWGNPETTTGGNALKFYATIRLEVRKAETLKKGDVILGSKVRIKVVKNKVAPPFKMVEASLIYGEGISRVLDLLEIGVKIGVVKKSGSWFSYKEKRIGQGLDNVKNYLLENPLLLKEIKTHVLEGLFPEEKKAEESKGKKGVEKERRVKKGESGEKVKEAEEDLENELDFFEED